MLGKAPIKDMVGPYMAAKQSISTVNPAVERHLIF